MALLLTLNSVNRVQGYTNNLIFTVQWPSRFNAVDGRCWRVCVRSFAYRSFERQLKIWQSKWSGKVTLLDVNENTIDATALSDQEKIIAILTWSALPGASRHHWGTDLDVYDKKSVEQSQHDFKLVCKEYEQGPCTELNNWLSEHASQFGFNRPYAEYNGGIALEPWHLSFQASADKMLGLLDEQVLLDNLRKSDIPGLDSIIANMPDIYQRFVLNRGLI